MSLLYFLYSLDGVYLSASNSAGLLQSVMLKYIHSVRLFPVKPESALDALFLNDDVIPTSALPALWFGCRP
jgi:hypothetical protein